MTVSELAATGTPSLLVPLARVGQSWNAESLSATGGAEIVAEGDVGQRMHKEVSPLSIYWEQWDGTLDPGTAFSSLDSYLAQDHPWNS